MIVFRGGIQLSMGRPRIFGPSSLLTPGSRFDKVPPDVPDRSPVLRVSLDLSEAPSEWDKSGLRAQNACAGLPTSRPRSENTCVHKRGLGYVLVVETRLGPNCGG
jgi:hypothetical protein